MQRHRAMPRTAAPSGNFQPIIGVYWVIAYDKRSATARYRQ
jgi:hypothetical protein